MKLIAFLLFIILTFSEIALAQQKLPILKATSNMVDIRDGAVFKKAGWRLAPEAKPDVYITNSKGENVVFITDIDSITIPVTDKTLFDFIILLNGSVECHTQVKYAPSFMEVLRQGKTFDGEINPSIPGFSYQDSTQPNLAAFRRAFNLDSVAGTGSEVSRIINLLHWVHYLIPHDGQHDNPVVKNAMSMIAECSKGDRGLNCRGLGTVLNEAYLSLGFKSRFLTCLPKDSTDTECHVINMVYSRDLKKWIWVDPTNDAYVMNEKGELLSVEEVRQRLINGQPLILNPDANWNRRMTVLKENYLYEYMAKNLYRFSCPIVSQYDSETPAKGKQVEYLELVPLDYYNPKPPVEELKRPSGSVLVTYTTNNPEVFWQSPE